jgi:two-component system CheB/CheR fusion protein
MINRDGDVIHLSDSVAKFLKMSQGDPTSRLVDMLPRQVRPNVRRVIAEAFSSDKVAKLSGVPLQVGRERLVMDFVVQPLPSHGSTDAFALVMFDQHRKPELKNESAQRPKGKSSTIVRDLEAELTETRNQLHITIDEHEATIEELKASNEELQSINEEQRATEEELEASKEELQSINEELQTINQEYRNKNEQLAELNADLVNLINSTEIATIFLDRQMRVRRYTPAVSALFNLRPGDAGRPLTDLSHRLDYPTMLDDAREVMRTLHRMEREVKSSNGLWYTTQISPYRSIDDRIDGVVLTFVDVTDRKHSEVERETLLTEVQATSIAKSNFIGVMSHELRTPLNAILGYADILIAGAVGDITQEQSKHLERIKTSASHLAHMIDDSLQSVRIEAGITSFDNEIVDIGALVREVAVVSEPLVSAKLLRFQVNIEDGPSIVSDPTRIRQILFNLLGNAVRYTDRGSISISSRVGEHGAMISIEDTGIGISQEHLDRIFERFWQVDQSKTRLRGGTGLGLMVSRSLARLMGGELEVSSELGKGSRFIVRLPLGDKDSLRP